MADISGRNLLATYSCFCTRSNNRVDNTEKTYISSNTNIWATDYFILLAYNKWDSSYKYLKQFDASVYSDGSVRIDNLEVIAEYGVSYPDFGGASWVSTMPDVSSNKGKYLWTRTTTTFTDNTSQISYQATYIGQNGAAGQNGTSVSISSIKYAVNQDQSTQPSDSSFNTAFPSLSQGDWLWTKTTYSNGSTAIAKTYIGTDGDDGSSVAITSATKTNGVTTVVLTDGSQTKTLTIADGADGDDGDPGLNGYVHVAWANSADGTTDFSTSVSSGKTYLGTYTDNTAADSQSPSAYSWTLIKGAQGNPGNDGKGISSVTQYFHPDPSADIADIPAISDTSKWKTAPSDFTGSAAFSETNRYLWTYTKTVYTNPSSTVNGDRYILGVWGAPGSGGSGTQGRGITSIVTQYCLHTSNSTSSRPAENYSGWSDDMPAYSDGSGGVQRYYWQRDKITYDQALNGSTIQYTTPTLMQGVNKTMLEVNTLNADFARVIVKQNNQTYINGANIYTGSVTAADIASYNALIKNLMAHHVEVDGDQYLYTDNTMYKYWQLSNNEKIHIAAAVFGENEQDTARFWNMSDANKAIYNNVCASLYGAFNPKFIYYANEKYSANGTAIKYVPRAAITDMGFVVGENLSPDDIDESQLYDRDVGRCLAQKYNTSNSVLVKSEMESANLRGIGIYSTSAQIPYVLRTFSVLPQYINGEAMNHGSVNVWGDLNVRAYTFDMPFGGSIVKDGSLKVEGKIYGLANTVPTTVFSLETSGVNVSSGGHYNRSPLIIGQAGPIILQVEIDVEFSSSPSGKILIMFSNDQFTSISDYDPSDIYGGLATEHPYHRLMSVGSGDTIISLCDSAFIYEPSGYYYLSFVNATNTSCKLYARMRGIQVRSFAEENS